MGLGEGGRKRAAAMWYLVGLPSYKNLRDGLKDLMARKQKWLPQVEEVPSDGIPLRARGKQQEHALSEMPKPDEPEKHWRSMSKEPRQPTRGQKDQACVPSRSQISRTNRAARYEAVRALHQQAISEREIARRLNMSRQTVHRFLAADAFPERSNPPYRGSILDPYKPYILDRWKTGCWNGTQLRQASQKAWLRRFRRSVSAFHFEPAEAPPGSRNLGGPDSGRRWCESKWPC
jgi:hypothetical protein